MYVREINVQDEILDGLPKYNILDENGKVLFANCSIVLSTNVVQEGSNLNKDLFDRIEGMRKSMNSKEQEDYEYKYKVLKQLGDFYYMRSDG